MGPTPPGSNKLVFILLDIEDRIQDFSKVGGGVHLRSTSKKGGPGGGPILGPMLKSLHRGPKGGGPGPLDPPPPRSAHPGGREGEEGRWLNCKFTWALYVDIPVSLSRVTYSYCITHKVYLHVV